MIDNIFGKEENTIEVCSGSVKGRGGTTTASREERESLFASLPSFFTVDINPDAKPDLVADGQNLDKFLIQHSTGGGVIPHITSELLKKCMEQTYLTL